MSNNTAAANTTRIDDVTIETGSAPARAGLALLISFVSAMAFNRVQNRLGHDTDLASRHAQMLIQFEQSLGLQHVEVGASQWLAHHPPLAYVASAIYPSVLALPWIVIAIVAVRDRVLNRQAMASLFLLTIVSLLPFWLFPTAPPRLAEIGVIDIVNVFPVFGGSAQAAANMVDLDASMPSLHMAWSWWCCSTLRRLVQRSRSRRTGGSASMTVRDRVLDGLPFLIPAVVALDVVFTGNHYLVDVAAGIALAVSCNSLFLRSMD